MTYPGRGSQRRDPKAIMAYLVDAPSMMNALADPCFVAVDVRCRPDGRHRVARFLLHTGIVMGAEHLWFAPGPRVEWSTYGTPWESVAFVHQCDRHRRVVPVRLDKVRTMLGGMWEQGKREIRSVTW